MAQLPRNLPPEIIGRQKSIDRRRALAEALMKQGQQPLESQMVGGAVMPISPLQAIAGLAQTGAGAFAANKADKDERQLLAERSATTDAWRKQAVEALSNQVEPVMPTGGFRTAEGQATYDAARRQPDARMLALALQGQDLGEAGLSSVLSQRALPELPKIERVDAGDRILMVDEQGRTVGSIAKGNTPDARLGAQTTMRGQDLSTNTDLRGQDVTMRGQDITAQTARRAQDIDQQKANALSPAQRAADSAFARDYIEFVQGGAADASKSIEELQDALSQLESGNDKLTGGVVGNIPKSLRDVFLPQSAQVQELVESTVQRSLRPILGAQFTEKEGERLIARVYNPRLGEAENAKRVRRLVEQLERAYANRIDAARYYEQHGTLSGFAGKLNWSINDFDPDGQANDLGAADNQLDITSIMQRYGGQ